MEKTELLKSDNNDPQVSQSDNNPGSTDNKFLWISLPHVPSPEKVASDLMSGDQSWPNTFNTTSIPLNAITARLHLYTQNTKRSALLYDRNRSKTAVLSELYEFLNTPIEKLQLTQLLLPSRSRGVLLTKHQLIRALHIYTQTENVKSGFIWEIINSIEIGKATESPTDEFISNIVSVLNNFWEECILLKNKHWKRLDAVSTSNNNHITLKTISQCLDILLEQRTNSAKTDSLYPFVETIFDTMYTLYKDNPELSKNSISLVLGCILNRSQVHENVVFNAICTYPKHLASSIWHSRSSIWDVIYGIDYLKHHDVQLWDKMLADTGSARTKQKEDKASRILVVKIEVGVPCSIMRCSRSYEDYEIIVDKISLFKDKMNEKSEGFCIEEKLDGERSCVHIWRDANDDNMIHTRFYSRGRILQKWYGSYVGDPGGIITKYLKLDYFQHITSLILDGEMITYDEEKGALLGFQDVKRCSEALFNSLKSGVDLRDEKVYNKFLCYDILYFNGESLQLKDLKYRKGRMAEAFKYFDFDEFKFMHIHKWKVGYDAQDLKTAMTGVIQNNGEGLVAKHWASFYFVGAHSTQWIKLKPYYLRNFVDELDVLILGKEGHNFVCGLYGDSEQDKHRDWFISFCVVRFGFTDEITNYINEKTRGFWSKYTRNVSDIEMHDHHVRFGALKPEYWIHPENSVVITVKAKSMANTSEHTPNKYILTSTLRHPYCIAVRHDKTYLECDTVSDYLEKVEGTKERDYFEHAGVGLRRKRRRPNTKMDRALRQLNRDFIRTLTKKDDLFHGITFCVKTDCLLNDEWVALSEINGILEAHGGNVVSDPSHYRGDKLLVIADRCTLLVNELKKAYNIFRMKWCEDSIRSGELVKFDPTHCLLVDPETMDLCAKNLDRFGCNYTMQYTERLLWKNSVDYVPTDGSRKDSLLLNRQQYESLGFTFYGKNVYFYGYQEFEGFHREQVECEMEIHGADVVDQMSLADVVVCNSSPEPELFESWRLSPEVLVLSGERALEMCRS